MSPATLYTGFILLGTLTGCTLPPPVAAPSPAAPVVVAAHRSQPKPGTPAPQTIATTRPAEKPAPLATEEPVITPVTPAPAPTPATAAAVGKNWSYRVVFATGLVGPLKLTVDGQSMGDYTSGRATGLLDASKPEFTFLTDHDECHRANYTLQLQSGQRCALVLHQKAQPADKDATAKKEIIFTLLNANTDRTRRTATLLLASAKFQEMTVKLGTTSIALTTATPITVPLPRNREGGDLAVEVEGQVLTWLDTQTVRDHAIIIYHEDLSGKPACLTFDNGQL